MMKDLFSLEGRVALVTGGSRGIGKMIARGFLEQGAKVYITARKAPACDQTAEELLAYGTCVSLPHDVSTVDGCKALTADFLSHENTLDILVNNAGAAWGEPFADYSESGWDKVMDLNVKSLFFLTQALHDALKKTSTADKPGKVINIASVDGIRINPWETYSYQASKAAVIHLTRRMAARLIDDNICVSGIAPGAFASEMNKAAKDHAEGVSKIVPAKRIGRDTDMAGTAVFLASRAGDYVVGDTLAVDGGVAYSSIGQTWG
ncbi:SDR family oxidoreductase [Hyphococcus lacteus]|uniref:SDR family oxidoreductase n=1 Tax=Hyphococcus lacteus TaxID=3143536 RepID=A0ABV3Z6X1_9PROT